MTFLHRKLQITTLTGMSISLATSPCWATEMAMRSPSRVEQGNTRTYTATGQYGSLPSSITVTVTLADDVITAVKVTPHATDPTSRDFQVRFAAAVPAVVVGKRIDAVKVGRLAGASGTPDGFNAAIHKIREQARAAQTTSK